MELSSKLHNLEKIIRKAGKVLVCFSGGVDSSLLLFLCKKFLAPGNVIAFTLFSTASSAQELEECQHLGRQLDVEHLMLSTDLLSIKEVAEGDRRRCYFCKKSLCRLARKEAEKRGIETIFEGSNADDKNDYRPGYEAVQEFHLASPLLEANLTKTEIRDISRSYQIPTWEKPAASCLITRFPYGVHITSNDLARVGTCENFLFSLGFRQFRVRCHGNVARIEIPPGEIALFTDASLRDKIVSAFKKTGFSFIALDLEGYRTGSLNEVLERKNEKL